MSETKNTFEIQLHDSTKSTQAVLVYSIGYENPSGTITTPTISARHFTIGDTKILRGSFRAEASAGFNATLPNGFILAVNFNNPVFAEIPQVFCQTITNGWSPTLFSTQVYNQSLTGFSVVLNCSNAYTTFEPIIGIDFMVVGV